MIGRNMFASILLACFLIFGIGSHATMANAASAGPSVFKLGESAGNSVIEVKRNGSGARIHLPIGPSSIYYDYPYYYSRGYYPTHIGGYVYYPHEYSRSSSQSYGGRCSKWHNRCAANWGKGNADYYGCMDYHGCD